MIVQFPCYRERNSPARTTTVIPSEPDGIWLRRGGRRTSESAVASCRRACKSDAAQQKDVTGDTDDEIDRRHEKRQCIRMLRLDDVAGDDGRGNPGDLAGKINDAADFANIAPRGNKGRNGPEDGRRRG